MKIFKRDKRGLSFFGKKVLNKTLIVSKTTKTWAGVQRFGTNDINNIYSVDTYYQLGKALTSILVCMLQGLAHLNIESFSIMFTSTKIKLVFL